MLLSKDELHTEYHTFYTCTTVFLDENHFSCFETIDTWDTPFVKTTNQNYFILTLIALRIYQRQDSGVGKCVMLFYDLFICLQEHANRKGLKLRVRKAVLRTKSLLETLPR